MKTNNQDRGTWTSASSAAADLLCPGRHICEQAAIAAEETGKLAPQETNEDALFGTRVHDALAKQDPSGLNPKELDVYESCQKIEADLITQAFPGVDPSKASGIREQRLWIQCGPFSHSGQPDVVHRKGTRALVLDYKTAPGEQQASSKNQQLRDLAVLLWVNTPMLQDVWVAVIQPLVTHKPEICVYTKNEIQQARLLLIARVTASNDPASPRVAGESQCKYCKAQRICVEYGKFAGAMLPVPKSIVDLPTASWTSAQWALFLENEGTAQKWLDGCHKLAKQMLEANPQAIPGFELVPGNTVEKITNAQGVFDRFSAIGGTLEEFLQCLTVHKTRLEPLVKTHTNTKGIGLKDEMKKLVAGCVESAQNAPSIRKVKTD